MKVLITGGCGVLGNNLIRYLLKRNIDDIIVLDIAEFNYPEKEKVIFYKGDIRNENIVSSLMKEVQVVVHAAAALPLYPKKEICSTNVDGTENLLHFAYKNKVGRFIYISSTAVYGLFDSFPFSEESKLSGVGHYGKTKIIAEGLCRDYRKKGMCVSILRPKSFIGPGRLGVFALLYEWAKDAKNFPMIGNGNNRYQLLDIEDLCEAIFLCISSSNAIVNHTFNIAAKDFTTVREDFQAVLDEAGYNKKMLPFPVLPSIMILRAMEVLGISPLYRWIYQTFYKDSIVSIKKAEQKLGFSPRYSNKNSLLRNFRWYLENIDSLQGRKGISHNLPWEQGILKLVKRFF
ncbi:MAG: NAD(P)-dependent oxidoreductase [Candidatus Omnitrophica bacterium]|nr:NAD(P)-dependent oxidoreductase [Candidatus Omnitrophota bacterium]